MQDIHSLTGGAPPTEHLFAAAAAAAGDRRLLRPTNQALKCPRCDSLNTKFCYYNNYNLSQPRHFCKSCRRYWTKGGVLRNVPVGSGCRKSKRSSTSSSSSNSKSSLSKPPPLPSLSIAKSQPRNDAAVAVTYNNINNSNGDSSVIAATASPVIPADILTLFNEYGASCTEELATTATASSLYGIEDIAVDHHHGGWRDDVSAGMLTEIMNFPSLIGSTAEIEPFGYVGMMSQHDHHRRRRHPQDRVVVDGFGPLDWEGSGGDSHGGDRGEELFDVTGAVDHAYWSQLNQWTAADDVVDHHHQVRFRSSRRIIWKWSSGDTPSKKQQLPCKAEVVVHFRYDDIKPLPASFDRTTAWQKRWRRKKSKPMLSVPIEKRPEKVISRIPSDQSYVSILIQL